MWYFYILWLSDFNFFHVMYVIFHLHLHSFCMCKCKTLHVFNVCFLLLYRQEIDGGARDMLCIGVNITAFRREEIPLFECNPAFRLKFSRFFCCIDRAMNLFVSLKKMILCVLPVRNLKQGLHERRLSPG